MDVVFQVLLFVFNYDLVYFGKGKFYGWIFFIIYNIEEKSILLEVNVFQNDKDFIVVINWKKVEEYIK